MFEKCNFRAFFDHFFIVLALFPFISQTFFPFLFRSLSTSSLASTAFEDESSSADVSSSAAPVFSDISSIRASTTGSSSRDIAATMRSGMGAGAEVLSAKGQVIVDQESMYIYVFAPIEDDEVRKLQTFMQTAN